jgi:small-conductance mechanosensitive channel
MRSVRSSHLLLLTLSLVFTGAARADVDGGLGPPPADFDRSTPSATIASYRRAIDARDFHTAAHALDLRGVPREERDARGAAYARTLQEVIDGYGLDLDARIDRATGTSTRLDLGQVPCDGQLASLVLETGSDATGQRQWVFSRETVASLDGMQRDVPLSWLTRSIPASLRAPRVLGLQPWQWIALVVSAALLALTYALGRRGARSVVQLVARRKKLSRETTAPLESRLAGAVGMLLAALAAFGLAGLLRASGAAGYWLGHASAVGLILAAGWLGARLIDAIADGIEARESARDGGGARGVRTRVQVVRRLLHVIGSVVVVATALVQFEAVRELGVSLFASAGLASVVLGFAAQKTLGNLLAGIQISITQPLRIGDDVQIEGDTGNVEEITLSYVVVRLGDGRRLIVPTAKLLETTFRNYTRRTTQLVGEVLIACDFETPIAQFRAKAEEFVRAHPDFDGETFGVHVVDTSDRAITLRVVASAKDAARAFELRTAIREWAVSFLRTLEGGRFVPHQRVAPPGEPHPVDEAPPLAVEASHG